MVVNKCEGRLNTSVAGRELKILNRDDAKEERNQVSNDIDGLFHELKKRASSEGFR